MSHLATDCGLIRYSLSTTLAWVNSHRLSLRYCFCIRCAPTRSEPTVVPDGLCQHCCTRRHQDLVAYQAAHLFGHIGISQRRSAETRFLESLSDCSGSILRHFSGKNLGLLINWKFHRLPRRLVLRHLALTLHPTLRYHSSCGTVYHCQYSVLVWLD